MAITIDFGRVHLEIKISDAVAYAIIAGLFDFLAVLLVFVNYLPS